MSSKTRVTTFQKLSDKDELGVVLGRLMMAVNDLGIANNAFGPWMVEQTDPIRKERQPGAKMYFVRILLSHAFEALGVLNKINGEPELLKVVRDASAVTQESFDKAIAVVGTKQWEFFRKVRNDIGFHYRPLTVRSAIARQSSVLLTFGSVLYIFLCESLLGGWAEWLTKQRGKHWVKELDYLYLSFGALGVLVSVDRIQALQNRFVNADIYGPLALTTAIVIRLIKTRAEISGWNQLPMPEDTRQPKRLL